MAAIRVMTEDDVPAVAALFRRVYPDQRWTSQAACESYFREMLFHNPWFDPELPSWVAEEEGRISGFYAVMMRPMLLRGRPIRVAVGCQFMVDPDKHDSLTALQLAKACLSGPQDLTLADGANDLSRRMWIGMGGTVPLLYNLHWTRPLRPARYLLSLLEERPVFPFPLTLAARPLSALVDVLAGKLRPNRFYREKSELAEDALDPSTMLAHLPEVFDGNALQPVYDARALAWLLEQSVRKTRYGPLRARTVRDGERLIGWYLYYVRAGGVGEVLQIAARNGAFDGVLQRLLADAWRHGAIAVRGRLEPRYAQELARRHCWFRREGSWTLIHSRHADITAVIQQGDAFLSRLEGEWWLRWMDA
jgi:Acetyltransferase (GNAT) domain